MKPMETIVILGQAEPPITVVESLPAPETMAQDSELPDARVYVKGDEGKAIAYAAMWWKDAPPCNGQKLGVIGGFSAIHQDSALKLLEAACQTIKDEGCTRVIGPMNGNTWRRYRFVDESDGYGPFFLEPRNPRGYSSWWRAAGFHEESSYSSSIMDLDGTETVSPAMKARLTRSGVTIRPLDVTHYDEELSIIHALSLRSFSHNFLYTPLDLESFIESYRKVKSYVDPDFVMIAEREGRACGFVFGIPDLEAMKRGDQPALIVKTLAVDPAARCPGLGSLLVDELHRIGKEKGYKEAIHALQHETNTSLKITGRHAGRAFRRYVLFSKDL